MRNEAFRRQLEEDAKEQYKGVDPKVIEEVISVLNEFYDYVNDELGYARY